MAEKGDSAKRLGELDLGRVSQPELGEGSSANRPAELLLFGLSFFRSLGKVALPRGLLRLSAC